MAVFSAIDSELLVLLRGLSRALSFEARISALSFPWTPTWLGIQQIVVLVPELFKFNDIWDNAMLPSREMLPRKQNFHSNFSRQVGKFQDFQLPTASKCFLRASMHCQYNFDPKRERVKATWRGAYWRIIENVGTKIIGFFSLVGYLIQLVISMMQSSGLDLEDSSLDTVEVFIIISSVIVSSALLACCVLLLQVVFSNSRPVLLIPWLVGDMIMRSIHAIILISGIMLAINSNIAHGVSTVFVMSCFIGLETYLWWIVLCYYRELRHHESTCKGATTAEMVAM